MSVLENPFPCITTHGISEDVSVQPLMSTRKNFAAEVGARVLQTCGSQASLGRVIEMWYDTLFCEQLYRIRYEDNDGEDVTYDELQILTKAYNDTVSLETPRALLDE